MCDIKNRSEILFLYDIQNANPNGDPNDENKPRLDEETGRNLVTDVRLKRTIRDYMQEKGNDIFVREVIYDKEGHIQDAKMRAKDFIGEIENSSNEDKEIVANFLEGKKISKKEIEILKSNIACNLITKAIDVRFFGATVPLEFTKSEISDLGSAKSIKSSITFTGPIQFKMGKSLHSVKILHIKGTGAFASGTGATQKTFREEDILPYSLIGFYGIVNENAAKHTNLQQKDIKLLKEAIWNGTKGLISRSKFGQMPRLLLVINYKQPDFFIGDLDNLIELKSDKRHEQLRKPEDYKIDISGLLQRIKEHTDKVENVEFAVDERMTFVLQEKEVKLNDLDKFTKISL